jgi:ABC-type transport system involved in cytochrome c biogenesis permease subunit
MARKPFALAGAAVGFLAAIVAYYAPVFDENINPLMPVLRDNFWLTLHVLTITASYGAGALAWGLGNLALAHYLFGRYHNPDPAAVDGHRPASRPGGVAPARRPPDATYSLGTFIYKSMQVAVLLLAAGTILGGLWADVSWGRFWGWDSKEVWALVSLLIYLAVLHGRYAGWFGNFGLAAGSVVGATSILMAWYGVNFVLGSGLHTYGDGAGGLVPVTTVVVLNWLFIVPAGLRYLAETAPGVKPQQPEATPAEARQEQTASV